MAVADAGARAGASLAINLAGTTLELINRTTVYGQGSLQATPTSVSWHGKGSIQRFTSQELENEPGGGDETVRAGDQKILVAAIDLETDGFVPGGLGLGFVKHQGVEFRIISVKPLISGDQIAMYRLQVRR